MNIVNYILVCAGRVSSRSIELCYELVSNIVIAINLTKAIDRYGHSLIFNLKLAIIIVKKYKCCIYLNIVRALVQRQTFLQVGSSYVKFNLFTVSRCT